MEPVMKVGLSFALVWEMLELTVTELMEPHQYNIAAPAYMKKCFNNLEAHGHEETIFMD